MDKICEYVVKDKSSKGDCDSFKLVKEYDDFAENPREFSDHDSVFFTFESRRYSPDKHSYQSFSQWAEKSGFNVGNKITDLLSSMDKKGYIAIPVWRYEHSGVCYKASVNNPFYDDWDSGCVGVIYISKEKARKEFGVKRLSKSNKEQLIDRLKAEVSEYSDYASGDVYCYSLVTKEGEVIESIGGFYGDHDLEDVFSYFGVVAA